MNTLHGISTSAVITRLHDVNTHRGSEKSGAVSGRGCARGTGRQHTAHAQPGLQPYMTVVDGFTGETHGGAAYREESGERCAPTETADAEAAFTAYVQERRASLYATAYHLTGDRFEAEDLLQSALFSTYKAWDRISDKAAVGGYLRRTMTNLHISAWRRRKLNEYPTEELPETAGDTDAMRGTELRAVLWQALARLPELQRTMLVLRYYEGRTDPEIAEILDISVGTVKSSIWRSLRRLREDEVLSFGRDEQHAFGELVA
ncbi:MULTISPECIES: SigE family RNA polymerase sigma factor [Streptomyces]|uniref:SigE family RNA polymerase sigma factor n=1 Tax=Streptomyces cadmiisoli TaxID=2184053 RepID=A0A2Z4IYK9_9ACTN|nr:MULTISPECIES: SigE family RNA polymerase sigma factor [Streptomyces]AWW37940.1 SigE family RNA polymerase sigma factor [Streptomyces cadmiisoli]KOV63847.1 RNA polymerase [Streptomyces sp. AS58]